MDDEMLPDGDPKIHLANSYFDSPIDLNEASYDEIIRVPGIGPKTAENIIEAQNSRKSLNSKKDIVSAGVILKRAEPFLKIDGNTQMRLSQYA